MFIKSFATTSHKYTEVHYKNVKTQGHTSGGDQQRAMSCGPSSYLEIQRALSRLSFMEILRSMC